MTFRTKLSIALLVLALGGGVFWFLSRSEEVVPETRQFSGIIREMRREGDALILNVDELEFLSGEEAIIKGMIDTGCARDEISDCIPSLNNDIYVRNLDPETRSYRLSGAAEIRVLESPGSPVLTTSTVERFELQYHDTGLNMNRQPFHFRAAGDLMIWAEEQYTP